jgi:hypothetical protein
VRVFCITRSTRKVWYPGGVTVVNRPVSYNLHVGSEGLEGYCPDLTKGGSDCKPVPMLSGAVGDRQVGQLSPSGCRRIKSGHSATCAHSLFVPYKRKGVFGPLSLVRYTRPDVSHRPHHSSMRLRSRDHRRAGAETLSVSTGHFWHRGGRYRRVVSRWYVGTRRLFTGESHREAQTQGW